MADYSDNNRRTIEDDIKDQQEVVRMLEARDEMNAAVHMTSRRLSPVTMAARRVLDTLYRTYMGDIERSPRIDFETDGTSPHKFVALLEEGEFPENPMCAVSNCLADDSTDEGEKYADHEVHVK